MRQAKVVVRVVKGQLLAYTPLAFAPSHHAPPDGGDMLADRQVQALNQGDVDLPALRGEHLLHSFQRPGDHPVADEDQSAASIRFDDLP